MLDQMIAEKEESFVQGFRESKKPLNLMETNPGIMKDNIQEFLDDKKVAIVGASPNKDNWGRSLMVELGKKDYQVFPVNPKCTEVEGVACIPTVRELPKDVFSVILAVPSSLSDEIIDQCIGTPIKRVWMIRGVGKGAYTESAHEKCKENNIHVVYGFCPLMFLGDGMHKFHFWLRKTIGKLPAEYQLADH
ncbi:MAG: CoA-binding protein [Bacteroidia bacterium]|nr:MAG: CoA-binding protein [Bacteroidia bacterium]